MDITENAKVVEKKVYEDGKKEYASKGVAGTALGLGIAGTALGLGAWLCGGGNRSVFGSLGGGNMPENVNINAYGYGGIGTANAPTALQVMEKECADEVKLLTDMFGMKLDTANKFYALRETDIAEKFSMYKGFTDGIFGLYKKQNDDAFGLYKNQRDMNDATNAKIADLEKKVAVMEAIRPYQDKLLMAYTDQKCCRKIDGVLGIQSAPTVTILPSASTCGCINTASTTTTA